MSETGQQFNLQLVLKWLHSVQQMFTEKSPKPLKKARSILINSSYHLSHVFRLQFVFLSHIRTCYKKCVWIILRYTEDFSSVYYSCFKVPNLVFWCIRGVSTVYSVASIKISIWTVEKFCPHYLFITFRRFLLIFMKATCNLKDWYSLKVEAIVARMIQN